MKYNPNKGYKDDWIDLCGDGRYEKRRIKGDVKKQMAKMTRFRLSKDLKAHIKEEVC